MNQDNIKRLYMDDETKKDFEKFWFSSHWRKENRAVQIISNGFVSPAFSTANRTIYEAAVLDENKAYVEGSAMAGYPVKDFIPSVSEEYDFIDKEVIWGGRLICHYGHFLIQSTIRLYYYIKNRDKNLPIVFVLNIGEKLPKYISDFFDLLEIPKDKIILIDKWTKFKSIYCPPISSEQYNDYTDDFVLPFRQAAKDIVPAKYKKVFFTRKYWTDTKSFGEQDIEKVFNKNGFKSIALEKLSLREQIAVMKGAEVAAGINGTAFHNALFAEPNLKLIMLNRNEEFDFQYIINEAVKADWYVIKVYANPFPVMHARGPFIVGMTNYLKEFFADHGLNVFDISFNVNKYIKEFFYLYCNIYGQSRFYGGLSSTGKDKIDALNVIRAFEISNYSLFKRIIYYFLYHITFGKLKRKYKTMHRSIKNFALNKNKTNWI